MLRAAAARPKLSLVTPAASSSRHRSRASLCEGSRMCCTVTSRVASFTFPTTSSSQLIAGAAGTRRAEEHAAARAVGGTAVKQAASTAFDDSRHRSVSARRRMFSRVSLAFTNAVLAPGAGRGLESLAHVAHSIIVSFTRPSPQILRRGACE